MTKRKHWHVGKCNPKLRIGINGVHWEEFFECCKKMESENHDQAD